MIPISTFIGGQIQEAHELLYYPTCVLLSTRTPSSSYPLMYFHFFFFFLTERGRWWAGTQTPTNPAAGGADPRPRLRIDV